jgi:hypothetical protein
MDDGEGGRSPCDKCPWLDDCDMADSERRVCFRHPDGMRPLSYGERLAEAERMMGEV